MKNIKSEIMYHATDHFVNAVISATQGFDNYGDDFLISSLDCIIWEDKKLDPEKSIYKEGWEILDEGLPDTKSLTVYFQQAAKPKVYQNYRNLYTKGGFIVYRV